MNMLRLYLSACLVALVVVSPAWSQAAKVRNPLKRRSLEENLELLHKMKQLYPVESPPVSIRARLDLPPEEAPVSSSVAPFDPVSQIRTPQPTNAPAAITPILIATPTTSPTETPAVPVVPTIPATVVPSPEVRPELIVTPKPLPTKKVEPSPKPRPSLKPVSTQKPRPSRSWNTSNGAQQKPVEYTRQAGDIRKALAQESNPLGTPTKYALVLKVADALAWPGSIQHFNLCGFDSHLNASIKSQMERTRIQGKALRVVERPTELAECHIVVTDDDSRIEDALDLQSRAPVLTVGIGRAFIKSGIGLALYVARDHTPALSVDQTRLEARGIKVGDTILRIADEVY